MVGHRRDERGSVVVISDLRASQTAGAPQRSRLFGELRSRPHRDHVRTFVNSNALPGDLMYEKIKEAGRSPFSHSLLFPLCQVRDWPSTPDDALYSHAMGYLMDFRLRPGPIAPRKTPTNHASEAIGVARRHARHQ